MKGIINKGIQEMVEKMFGEKTWQKVKSLAGCKEPFFAISLEYPDKSTLALVKAASEVTGLPMETVMIEYGKFIVPNTLKENYPAYFKLAGSSAKEFLLNMDRVHNHVTKVMTKVAPPRFEYEEVNGKLLMKYQSKRKLCPVLHGLILGVGILFEQELQVKEIACMQNGDSHCIMEVTFP